MEVDGQQSDPQSDTLKQLANMAGGTAGSEEIVESESANANAVSQENEMFGDQEDAPGGFEADGQIFASEKDAYEYMKGKYSQSETDRMILEAKQEGIQEALQFQSRGQSYEEPAVAQDANEINIDEFYEDPQKFLKSYGEKIRESVKSEVLSASESTRREEQAWSEFFSAHSDLEGFKDDCQMVLNANLEVVQALARRDKKKAMDFLATKTREKFQNYIERTKPTRTLSNTKGGPSMSSGNVVTNSVTQKSAGSDDSGLDFAAQLRNMKTRFK